MTLLTLENVTKGFNDRSLFTGLSLEVGDGDRIGLLGRNGSGKSSLLRILAGLDQPDEGLRTVRRGLRLGYLEQEPILDPGKSIREIVREGLGDRPRLLAAIDAVHEELSSADAKRTDQLLNKLMALEADLERMGGHDVEHRIESTLQALDLIDFDAAIGHLSGGERRRVALARLLLQGPELLLLDEPTNHLDAFVTDWLEDWFIETKTPLVLVTHDRYFLDRVVDRIVELDRGRLVEYQGGYGDYLEQRSARLVAEGNAESARQNLLRRETEWMRRGPPARTTKSKARIQRYETIVQGAPVKLSADLEFAIPPGPRLGSKVIIVEGLRKSYGDRTILNPLDLELQPGMRLGIVGQNGAGKTTLVRMLVGDLAPDGGTRAVGETVVFMGIDQMRSELDLDATVTEAVAGRADNVFVDGRAVRIESFLDKFGFDARMRSTVVRQLSGGERNRVLLAKLLTAGGNVLVLDEPTNDLDLATLRSLEEALLVFPGAAIVVSHDRWFLDRVATHILYLDGTGAWRLHHGDLSALLVDVARERDAARVAARDKARATTAAAPAAAAPKPKKLNNAQARELATVEGKIQKLEEALEQLDTQLADPALYSGAADGVARLVAEREKQHAQLAALYAKWEELEALRG
ncbi:MAG: ATP-binding cassette domain-containing protein [Planctomycetota bacterium]